MYEHTPGPAWWVRSRRADITGDRWRKWLLVSSEPVHDLGWAKEVIRLVPDTPDLLEAAQDFIRKVDEGRARSVDSYAKFSAAMLKAEGGGS